MSGSADVAQEDDLVCAVIGFQRVISDLSVFESLCREADMVKCRSEWIGQND